MFRPSRSHHRPTKHLLRLRQAPTSHRSLNHPRNRSGAGRRAGILGDHLTVIVCIHDSQHTYRQEQPKGLLCWRLRELLSCLQRSVRQRSMEQLPRSTIRRTRGDHTVP
jgi:hypothetical protein